ncbi:MAG: L,D-transpeptidase family protein [Methylococcaceae bacterium]|nr:L,D-transpeptidase family protein [Methylococcaceae bacterium]
MAHIRSIHDSHNIICSILLSLMLSVYSSANYAVDYTSPTSEIIAEMIQGLIVSTPLEKKASEELYRLSNNSLIWLNNKETEVALKLLTDAGAKGLNSEDYHSKWLNLQWQALQKNLKPSFHQLTLFDATLSSNLLHYYSDLRYGRINPRQVRFRFNVDKDPITLAQQTFTAIQKGTTKKLSDSLEPNLIFYSNLKKALGNYQKAAKDHPLLAFKFTKTLKVGDSDPQLVELRALLVTLGDFIFIKEGDSIAINSIVYDKAMAEAIKNVQERHGLKVTGKLDKKTVKVLNTPLSMRVNQIELGLERLRWIPRHEEDQLVFVNIPSFRLWAFDSLKKKKVKPLTMRVVVGKASKHQTPVFTANMKHLIFRPYWNIPYSILKNEIMPKISRNPNYLARSNMERVGKRVRQRPGNRNALGLVKFMFPNKHAVYLHDTPSKRLFKRTRRDFSHGCIRVAQPADLAQHLLSWDAKKVKRAMQRGNSRRVNLKAEVPVVIFYSTVMATSGSSVTFLNDIYGHDARLKRELNKKQTSI